MGEERFRAQVLGEGRGEGYEHQRDVHLWYLPGPLVLWP